jgi:hypothetical protein
VAVFGLAFGNHRPLQSLQCGKQSCRNSATNAWLSGHLSLGKDHRDDFAWVKGAITEINCFPLHRSDVNCMFSVRCEKGW